VKDPDIQAKLLFVQELIRDCLKRYVGEPMNEKTLAAAKKSINDVIIRLDMSSTPPYVSNLVDVMVEYDEDDPTMMVIFFKRK